MYDSVIAVRPKKWRSRSGCILCDRQPSSLSFHPFVLERLIVYEPTVPTVLRYEVARMSVQKEQQELFDICESACHDASQLS